MGHPRWFVGGPPADELGIYGYPEFDLGGVTLSRPGDEVAAFRNSESRRRTGAQKGTPFMCGEPRMNGVITRFHG
jgi:hypothetical protein